MKCGGHDTTGSAPSGTPSALGKKNVHHAGHVAAPAFRSKGGIICFAFKFSFRPMDLLLLRHFRLYVVVRFYILRDELI